MPHNFAARVYDREPGPAREGRRAALHYYTGAELCFTADKFYYVDLARGVIWVNLRGHKKEARDRKEREGAKEREGRPSHCQILKAL